MGLNIRLKQQMVVKQYEKDFMKRKFNSDDNLLLNKPLKLYMLTISIRSVFQEDNKYYPQVFWDECFYEL